MDFCKNLLREQDTLSLDITAKAWRVEWLPVHGAKRKALPDNGNGSGNVIVPGQRQDWSWASGGLVTALKFHK